MNQGILLRPGPFQHNHMKLLIGLACILMVSILQIPMAAVAEQEGDAKSRKPCCGGTGVRWYFTRSVNGVVVDADFLIPKQGEWVYTATPSKTGGMLFLGAFVLPRDTKPEGLAGPEFEVGTRYYHGTIPGFGRIVAMQHEPGETWTFNYNGYEVIDTEGYEFGGTFSLKVNSSLKGRWDETWDEVEIGNGVWAAIECTGQVDFICGSTGLQYAEMPEDYQKLGLIEINLEGLGNFYGRCHDIGEVWTVTIDNRVFSGTVLERDPSAIPIDVVNQQTAKETDPM